MSSSDKQARTDVAIHPLVSSRWSPYCYASTPVSPEDLRAILEAARWAPSSYNEQPWRYILAQRSDGAEYERLLSCLVEGNQAWAKHAPVLMIGVVVKTFSRNGKPNRAAEHDLGLAAGNICTEATARGLFVHQMIGIVPDRVRELYGLPAEAEALTGLAIGYLGDGAGMDDAMKARDQSPRTRRTVDSFVFTGAWERPSALTKP